MIKKLLPLVTILALLLSGCSTSGSVENAAPVGADSVAVRFSWWGNDNRHEYTMNGIKLFEEANPDIAVRCKYGVWQGFERRMKVAMESHTEADVMQINFSWLDQYSPDGGRYYDLYKLADYIDLSNYDETDLQYGIRNGKLNAIPIAFNSYEFYYNKGIWNDYGLEFPTKWDQFFEAADLMRADGIYPLGCIKKQTFMMIVSWFEQSYGKSVFDDEGNLNVEAKELGKMLDFYRDLIDKKVLMPVDNFNKSEFADGKVAATMCWVSDAGNYCGALESKGGVPEIGGYVISEDAKLTGCYIKPATMYAISTDTEHPEAAARLLNFLVNSPDMAILQMSEKGVPVSRIARETIQNIPDSDLDYEFKANAYMNENIDKLSIIKPIMENDEVISAFKECGDEYIYNKLTKEKAAEQLYEVMMEITNK